ncbi:hypothetical protein EWM64_g3871 [Hericium alpestre]|uniref:Autophagy-related protein 14 n=1 Tax=Hericium alpestre TaxID=135208 RepID=A0A4Y9ZZ20_9AGAM|nr:hypothetical protein EWM64_g3871 [Hericium alpestre]
MAIMQPGHQIVFSARPGSITTLRGVRDGKISSIVDTQQSLQGVVHEIDNLLAADETAALRREIREREARVAQYRTDSDSVRTKSESLSASIAAKRESLRCRRETLAQARQLENEALSSRQLREEEIAEERSRVQDLHNRIRPVRITLVSTLASIFPIDLLSGPDLLYTILQVPLPIPLGTTDPAPPLSLPSHKEVTEDAVATALGYAALVVQLLAVYLNKGLVYPITPKSTGPGHAPYSAEPEEPLTHTHRRRRRATTNQHVEVVGVTFILRIRIGDAEFASLIACVFDFDTAGSV